MEENERNSHDNVSKLLGETSHTTALSEAQKLKDKVLPR